MRLSIRASGAVLVAVGLLMTLSAAGCGDKAGSDGKGGTSDSDAVKYMGGPPPGKQMPAAGAGGQAAPPGPQGAAPGGQGR